MEYQLHAGFQSLVFTMMLSICEKFRRYDWLIAKIRNSS